jgi:predicted N-acetyltransferase YhbS
LTNRTIRVVPASGEILEDILDKTHPVWGEGLDRSAYARYNAAQLKTPWGSRHLARVALVDGARWLSTAKRYRMRVSLRGRELDALGIGAVFTPPNLRRRGFAAELVNRLLSEAASDGASLALLFSEIDPRYYEQFGFRSLPITQLVLDVSPGRERRLRRRLQEADIAHAPPAIPLRSGEPGDAPAVAEMNAIQASGFAFHLVRSPEYGNFALAKKRLLAASSAPGAREVEFLAVEEGGRAAGYVVVLEAGEYWMITECGDRDPSGARVGAIVQAILARPGRRPSRLRAWLPANFLPPQLEILWRETPPIVMMLAPLGRFDPGPPLRPGEVCWWHADAF